MFYSNELNFYTYQNGSGASTELAEYPISLFLLLVTMDTL